MVLIESAFLSFCGPIEAMSIRVLKGLEVCVCVQWDCADCPKNKSHFYLLGEFNWHVITMLTSALTVPSCTPASEPY